MRKRRSPSPSEGLPHLRRELAAMAACALLIGWMGWRTWAAPFVGLSFDGTQVELVEDMAAMCGPGQTTATGSMSVPVDYFSGATQGRSFQVAQYRHEKCPNEGCPTRVFEFHGPARRLIINALLPILDSKDRGSEAGFRLSRDGGALHYGGRRFALTGP